MIFRLRAKIRAGVYRTLVESEHCAESRRQAPKNDISIEGRAMLELITLIEFIVAFLMGLAACCFLLWGILDGAFENLENIKHRILEIEKDEP